MLDIAICDNDRIFTENFEIMLLTIALKEHIKINIDVYYDGIELIHGVCNKNMHYDIIFLEIKMKYMDGLETTRRIMVNNDYVYIIYATNYYNYAIVAYDVQPFQFLVKPIDLEVLHKYFLSAVDKIL